MTYFHVSAYLRIKSAHAQSSKNAKIATAIVSFFLLAFFDKLYDLYFKWMKEIFHERLTTNFLMALGYIIRIGYIITKVRRVDLEREGGIETPPPLLLPRPPRSCFLSQMKLWSDIWK